MPATNSATFSKILRTEVPIWIDEGIVSNAGAQRLLARYPLIESKSRLVGLITFFGSILVGLGVLLFVGSNWDKLSAFFKLGLINATIGAATYGGWFFSKEENARPKLGQSLYLLGGLLYGAGIWLVAQTFQLDLNWSLGMALWSVGLVPMVLLLRSSPLAILNALVLLCWSFSDHHHTEISLLVLAIAIALSYLARSRFALVVALIQGEIFATLQSGTFLNGNSMDPLLSTLLFAGSLFAWYLWHKEHEPEFASPYLYVGLLILLPTFLTMTNLPTSGSLDWRSTPFLTTVILAFGSVGYVVTQTKKYANEVYGCFIAILLMVLLSFYSGNVAPVRFMANVVYFGSVIALIYSGARRVDSIAMVNLSTVFFSIAVLCRYFDTFYQMLDRSIFFLLGGTVLLVGGYLLEQQRRTLIRGINQ